MSLQQMLKTSNQELLTLNLVKLDKQEVLFTFKSPSRAELESARSIGRGNTYLYYEALIAKCVVSPTFSFEDYKEDETPLDIFLPGEIIKLGLEIEKSSGLSDGFYMQKYSSEAEEYISSESGKLDSLALAVLPQVSLEDLLNYPPQILFRTWKVAELIATANGIDPRIFLNPEEYVKDVKKQQREKMLAAKLQEAEYEAANAMSRRGKQTQRSSKSSVSL